MTTSPIAHTPTADLPFMVCPTCSGHGTHGPGHVWTASELEEQFGPEADAVMEDYRRGMHDVVCFECNGMRVVRDLCACKGCETERVEEAEVARWEAMERRYC